MEDVAPYGKKPSEKVIVYKFELYQKNPEILRAHVYKNLSSLAAYKMIPPDYKICDEATIKGKDYYMVVHLKRYEDNICYYYVKNG